MGKRDHAYIVGLIDAFKEECINAFRKPSSTKYQSMMKGLRDAYDDLVKTAPTLAGFRWDRAAG